MKNKIALGLVCVTLFASAMSCSKKTETSTTASNDTTTVTAVDTVKTAPADTLKK